ncbi:MAG: glycosyltransferase [Solirubrobacteraceae bacterium]|nr:glycosyltransferase [Solirubrobacteraceae bacterium]
MARVSIVVPVYNVEAYLRECLDSVAAQSFADLEVILVDDGSSDSSAAIAQEFADRDERFRLVRQPNGGLGNARNNGAAMATGEFLNFLDSDDVLPRHAIRMLVRSLDKTGSDFATGNVHRFGLGGTSPAPFVARAFGRNRPATHITKFRGLLVDRIAPNKLFRRSFWDKHGFRFPEGVTHEDIPVVLPAHFLAKSVDVIAEPVYLYRLRETGGLSITQRRLEPKVLLDRLSAVSHVSRFLAKHRRRSKRWYDHSVVAEDLRYYVNVLPHADEAYRELFLDEVNAFLDTVSPKAFEPLLAIERLKWELVRRRLMPELLEVIRFQREDLNETVPVEVDGRWYGDYPYRTDAALALPAHVYELRQELTLAAQLDSVRWEGDRAHIEGSAFITAIGAATEDAQRVSIVALRAGRFRWWRRVRRRMPWLGVHVRTEAVLRPELTAETRQRLVDVSWAGFSASVTAGQLSRFRFGRGEEWELYADVHAGKVSRRTVRFATTSMRPVRGADRRGAHDMLMRAAPSWGRRLLLELKPRWAMVGAHELRDGEVVLRGELHGYDGDGLKLELLREEGLPTLEYPMTVDRSTKPASFSVGVPPADLLLETSEGLGGDDADEDSEQGIRWQLQIVAGRRHDKIALAEDTPMAAHPHNGVEIALHRLFTGDGALVVRTGEPVLTEASWTDSGALVVRGQAGVWAGPLELVFHSPHSGAQFPFPVVSEPDGSFAAELTPAAVSTLAGPRPLRLGSWHLCARPPGVRDEARLAPLVLARPLLRALPLDAVIDHKPFSLGAMAGDRALLTIERDLADDERGTFHQRRLVRSSYAGRRTAPLRDAVVYTSFGGRQASDSPLAIQTELARRGAPLEHLWVGHDGMVRAPEGTTLLRAGSREYYEAFATARYVVGNDHFPEIFERREDQICLQTWHGTPLKRLGLDITSAAPTQRRFEGALLRESASWQYVLSPSAYATPLLRRAYAIEGEILETGLPRNDVLAAPGRDERSRAVRERLGLDEDTRVVLYAPTYRDHVLDRRGRLRLDRGLDVERLSQALGPDTVVLYRKHQFVVDPVPTTPDGAVRDATSYPDANELMLAADVLVTDYSAMLFDFAITGRPIVVFAYDLETYRDEVRGLYLDLEEIAPGPVVRTTDELAGALGDLDAIRAGYADRYAAFTERFCPLDDGQATARVIERVFGA